MCRTEGESANEAKASSIIYVEAEGEEDNVLNAWEKPARPIVSRDILFILVVGSVSM